MKDIISKLDQISTSEGKVALNEDCVPIPVVQSEPGEDAQEMKKFLSILENDDFSDMAEVSTDAEPVLEDDEEFEEESEDGELLENGSMKSVLGKLDAITESKDIPYDDPQVKKERDIQDYLDDQDIKKQKKEKGTKKEVSENKKPTPLGQLFDEFSRKIDENINPGTKPLPVIKQQNSSQASGTAFLNIDDNTPTGQALQKALDSISSQGKAQIIMPNGPNQGPMNNQQNQNSTDQNSSYQSQFDDVSEDADAPGEERRPGPPSRRVKPYVRQEKAARAQGAAAALKGLERRSPYTGERTTRSWYAGYDESMRSSNENLVPNKDDTSLRDDGSGGLYELSSDTLSSYQDKARDDYAKQNRNAWNAAEDNDAAFASGRKTGDWRKESETRARMVDANRKTKNRSQGLTNANAKLTNRGANVPASEPVNELSTDTLGRYTKRSSKDIRAGQGDPDKLDNRMTGYDLAHDKIQGKAKVPARKLDEIGDTEAGKKALGSYIKKSANDMRNANLAVGRRDQGKVWDDHITDPEQKEYHRQNKLIAKNRETGIKRAADRLVKEGAISEVDKQGDDYKAWRKKNFNDKKTTDDIVKGSDTRTKYEINEVGDTKKGQQKLAKIIDRTNKKIGEIDTEVDSVMSAYDKFDKHNKVKKNAEKRLSESADRIEIARRKGQLHGFEGASYSGTIYDDPAEAAAYLEGYKAGLDECYGTPVEEGTTLDINPVESSPLNIFENGEFENSARFIEECKDGIKELLNNAFDEVRGTPLEQRSKSYWYYNILQQLDDDHMILGGSPFSMQDCVDSLRASDDDHEWEEDDNLYESWTKDFTELLGEDISVNHTTSISDSGEDNISISVNASGPDADELTSLLKNAGLLGDTPSSELGDCGSCGSCSSCTPGYEDNFYSKLAPMDLDIPGEEEAGSSEINSPGLEIIDNPEDEDDGLLDLLRKYAGIQTSEEPIEEPTTDYKDEDEDDSEHFVGISLNDEEEELREWANSAGMPSSRHEEIDIGDLDYMNKLLAGGPNKPKSTGQATTPVLASQEDRLSDPVAELKRLSGL